jgi:predicted acetyltransferase
VLETLVPAAEQADLAAMTEGYVAEMAAFDPAIPSGFVYPDLALYWAEPERRWPFWLKLEGGNAGFALVRRDRDDRLQIAEFFVLRRFRRQGVGLAAARRLIGRFPGVWRITQRETNAGAIAFWHRVLDGFVAYEETTTTRDAIRREQRFSIP